MGMIDDDTKRFEAQAKAANDAAAAKEAANPSKYGRGFYADPEGMAELYRTMGGSFLGDSYAYKPDIQGVNNAAAQHTAQLLYSMPGAEEGMGGVSRLSKMMQASMPVLGQKQQALSAERQRAMAQRNQQALMALQSYGAASNEYGANKQLQLGWDQFTEGNKMERQKMDQENSFGFGDILGTIGGALLPGIGGGIGKVLGDWVGGGSGKSPNP